ncbi:MAG: glutamyl-tRNA reductase [Chloroflexi bacterium]|nr:glutamyl-tRNA reductase [Chloroflexota bacterium]
MTFDIQPIGTLQGQAETPQLTFIMQVTTNNIFLQNNSIHSRPNYILSSIIKEKLYKSIWHVLRFENKVGTFNIKSGRSMHIYCLGLNHTTTPINLREQFSLSEDAIRSALARLACGYLSTAIAELIIISTCNRIEIYTASGQSNFSELEDFLSDVCGIPANQFRPHSYQYKNLDAARHLFEVAAGLDSLVIGEPQILGQIVRALELSRGQNMAGPILNRLFQSAIHAGKRARTDTAISRNPASVSSLAASLAERVVHPIAEAQVVIIGAGEMAELAVEALRKRGAQKILVVNRTLDRARAIADRWGADIATFENINDALISADILISSTGAPHLILTERMVSDAMTAREHRPLVLIDIAVPRDIDSDAANIPHVKLYDIDNLNAKLEGALAERMAEVPQVKSILDEEIKEFDEYMKSLEMIPIISNIRQQAEIIRKEMFEKTLRRLPELTDAERARIEAMTQALVKQILHAPTNRLRAEASCPHAPEYAAVARTLFGLQSEGLCGFAGKVCELQPSTAPSAD